MIEKQTEEQIKEMQKEVITWCKEFEKVKNMDLDICIEKAKEALNDKEGMLKELNKGEKARFKVITNHYYLSIEIKERGMINA